MVPAIEALHGPLRPAPVGGHLAGLGGRRLLRGRARWSATTSAGSPTPTTWPVCAAAGASVVATHIRLRPRVPDPEPVYDDVVATVVGVPGRPGPRRGGGRHPAGADHGRRRARPGQDRGRSPWCCCADPTRWPALGYPVFLSASNKRFLWKLLDVDVDGAALGTVAAHALGVGSGLSGAALPRRGGRSAGGRRAGRHPGGGVTETRRRAHPPGQGRRSRPGVRRRARAGRRPPSTAPTARWCSPSSTPPATRTTTAPTASGPWSTPPRPRRS